MLGVRGGWLWQGGAHRPCGLKVGAAGDEEVEAVELAVARRIHEGRAAVLQRHADVRGRVRVRVRVRGRVRVRVRGRGRVRVRVMVRV